MGYRPAKKRGQWPYRSAGSRAMKCDLITTMRQWRMRMNYSVLIQITCNWTSFDKVIMDRLLSISFLHEESNKKDDL